MGPLLLLSLLVVADAGGGWFYGRDRPDAWTQGGVWPLPQSIHYGGMNRTVSPGRVVINADSLEECDIVQENVRRYLEGLLFPFPVEASPASPYLLSIRVESSCPTGAPQQGMDESYRLKVSSEKAVLEAKEAWGVIRGLETFSQLVFYDEAENTYKLRTAIVEDFPRFSVRGLLLDTSRHFLSVKTIKRQMDLMASNKLNLLHWHIVDSESFPYESAAFPVLSAKGAYSHRHVYNRSAVDDIIAYARLRGIRVMAEFDTPGHTSSWAGQNGLLTECFNSDGDPTGLPNLIDPEEESNFRFLEKLLEEVSGTFPERFLHLGGDEISDYLLECWTRNKKIQEFMRRKGFGNDTRLLENYYFTRLQQIVENLAEKRDAVLWQEVFDNNIPNNSSIIHLWKGNTFAELSEQIRQATKKGHRVIVSACWYLNYVKYGADWRSYVGGNAETNSRYYYCDPTDFIGTPEQKSLVLGGIATMWGEMIDNTNIEAILWPRASAVAERLWSPLEGTRDAAESWPRLHELRCRLVARGFRVSPTNFPDYCPFEFDG